MPDMDRAGTRPELGEGHAEVVGDRLLKKDEENDAGRAEEKSNTGGKGPAGREVHGRLRCRRVTFRRTPNRSKKMTPVAGVLRPGAAKHWPVWETRWPG